MTKIETSLLAKQVYNQMRQHIMTRQYRPGQKLDMQSLADTFGVSRSPVKDAIQQLVHEGLLEVIPRKGTYVTEIQLDDFLEVIETRLMIEQWASNTFLQAATNDQIVALQEIVTKMDQLLTTERFNFEEYSELDMIFHQLIVEWSTNKRIASIYRSLNTHVILSRIVYSTSLESTIERHKDHHELLAAIEQQNQAIFHSTIEQHLTSLKEEAISRWEEQK